MRWRHYHQYKPSGVEWLGEVPENWHIIRLKYTSSLNDEVLSEGTDPDYEIQYVDISSVDASEGIKKKEIMRFEEAPSRARRRVRDGDVIISTVRTYLRAIAPIHNPEENLIVSTGFAVVRPIKGVNSHFVAYALRAPYFVEAVVARSVGVSYPAVNASEIGDLKIALPTDSEQSAITAFLDRETARIDALMEKKQRQIELLQEKRAALISHAVTKGLDPSAPLKDSGVEWLGQIPANWEIKKLKYLVEGGLINGLFKKKEFFGSGIKLVNVFDVYRRNFLIDHTSLDRVEADKVEQSKYAVRSGDIFFVRSSLKLEGVGRSVCALEIEEPTVFECHVVRGRPIQPKISPKFLIHFLNSTYAINRFISLANLVTMATIDQDKIKSLEVPLPPRDEQDKIMAFLERETETMEKLEKSITKSIEKLKEHRTALISAAVTGKIDVREAAA